MAYQSPMGLPDEHMRLVGIIAAHWEHVDIIMQRAIAEVMEHPPDRVALLTTNIGFVSKCDLLTVYARPLQDADPDDWKAFNKVMQGIREAYSLRNRYVHAAWEPRDGALHRHSIRTSGGKLAQTDVHVTIDELENAAQQIVKAGAEFGLWMQEHDMLQPLHGPNE